MSTTENAPLNAAVVGHLVAAAQSNVLALDHLIRLRSDGRKFAEEVSDDLIEQTDLRDSYVATSVLQLLADAEQRRHDGGHGSSSQAGLSSFAGRNAEGGS